MRYKILFLIMLLLSVSLVQSANESTVVQDEWANYGKQSQENQDIAVQPSLVWTIYENVRSIAAPYIKYILIGIGILIFLIIILNLRNRKKKKKRR